jgi:hypothetical protein
LFHRFPVAAVGEPVDEYLKVVVDEGLCRVLEGSLAEDRAEYRIESNPYLIASSMWPDLMTWLRIAMRAAGSGAVAPSSAPKAENPFVQRSLIACS